MSEIKNVITEDWSGHSHGEVEDALKDKLSEMEQSIEDAASAGGYNPPATGIPKSDLEQSVQDTLDSVANKVEKEQGKGLSSNDYTDADKAKVDNLKSVATSGSYNDLTDKPTIPDVSDLATKAEVSAKAYSADVYTKSEVDGKVADAGKVKSVSVNGQTPAQPDANGNVNLVIHDGEDGITPHIGQDGYWYIGTTNTGVKAQGQKGDSGVSSADEVVVVNDLDGDPDEMEEGQVAVLSAEMGKELAEMIGEMGDGGSTVSIEGDTLVITDNTSPVLHMVPSVVHFGDTLFGQTATATVKVSGKRLTGNVTIALTGSGFSANKQTLTPDADGNLTDTIIITFAPTGSGEDVEFSGLLTATHDGVQMASVEIDGTGVAEIVPSIDVKMDGEDVSAIALKGVLSSTAEGDYSDAPSKATLHIQGKNISNGVTLALTSGTKFALSKSSLTAEEALAGADIVVSYNRQAAVTQTDDTDTLTIACQDLQGDITIGLTGATGEKNTTHEAVVYSADDITYYNYGNNVGVRATQGTGNMPRTFNGPLAPPAVFYDDYGYKYIPSFIGSKGFYKSGVTSVELGEDINAMYGSVFQGCTSLTSVKLHEVVPANSDIFNGCTSLVTFDCVKFSISYNNMFKDCTKLETYIIRRTDAVETFSSGKTDVMPSTEIDGNTVYYYVDSNGVNRQKKLYVPQALATEYAAHSEWGKFDVQAIEGSEFDTAQSTPVALRSTLRASATMAVKKVRKNGVEMPIGADAQNVSYSGDVAGATTVKDALDALAAGAGSGGSTPDMSQYGYYGQNYPEQMRVVKNMLDKEKYSSYPRLRFIHISDSHSDNIGNADDLLANTAADFAVHTGDGVGGNYDDGVEGLYAKMLACAKPFFFAIGNHDCLQSPSLAARYTRYIEPIVTKSAWYQSSGVTLNHPEGKTYYSVDYVKGSAKYKCIFLDQADGLDANPDNSATIFGRMTDDQVVWFIGQLQDAATNANHVMVFMHVKPCNLSQLQGWGDHITYLLNGKYL